MELIDNRYRGGAPEFELDAATPEPMADPERPLRLIARCPAAAETPLRAAPGLAQRVGVAEILVKDERARMGLGSFKALGAAFAIAAEAEAADPAAIAAGAPGDALEGRTFVTASAGNHGLSVAAGARVFGAKAVVFLAETVPDGFARRLEAAGAETQRAGADYEQSMAAAARFAEEAGATLLSDSSWEGCFAPARAVMEGYLVMMAEIDSALAAPPSHIFLQAGVGGMAAAAAAFARARWGDAPVIVAVEPAAAPALYCSISAGRPVHAQGPVSSMGRLDCKEPSWIALKGLARDANAFALISEDEAEAALPILAEADLATSPSGGAGLAAILASAPHRAALGLDAASRALAIVTEGPQA